MKTLRTLSILFALVAVPSLALADRGHGGGADKQARRAEKLAEFDTNKDGKLDDTERTVMREVMTERRFTAIDADGDGVISKAEFKAHAKERSLHKGHGKKAQKGKKGQQGQGKKARGARRGKGVERAPVKTAKSRGKGKLVAPAMVKSV